MTVPNPQSNPAQQQHPDIDPAFKERINAIYHQWHDGELPFAEALKKLEALWQEAVDEGNLINQGGIENILGIMQGYRGNYDESIPRFKKALDLFNSGGAKERMVSCVLNIGETYRLRGNFTRARTYFHRAYETSKELNRLHNQSVALANEGQMWISLNSIEKARSTLEKALAIGERATDEQQDTDQQRIGNLDNLCEIHHALVTVCLHEDNPQQAWQHARESYKIAQQLNREIRIGYANRAIGDVITRLDTIPDDDFTDNPDVYYDTALSAFRNIKSESEVGKTLLAKGKSLVRRNKKRSASRLFQQAMVIFTRLGMTDDAARAAEAQMSAI
jgi:tetratricopeptide (TPR) repeat protein